MVLRNRMLLLACVSVNVGRMDSGLTIQQLYKHIYVLWQIFHKDRERILMEFFPHCYRIICSLDLYQDSRQTKYSESATPYPSHCNPYSTFKLIAGSRILD